MASIDHTCICFHNGKLMKDTYDSFYTEYEEIMDIDGEKQPYTCFKTVDEINLIPFKYNRDGGISHEGYDFKVYPVGCDDHNLITSPTTFKPILKCVWKLNDYISKYYDKKDTNNWLKYESGKTYSYPARYDERYYYHKDDNVEIIHYVDGDRQIEITYYMTSNDSYVILGGYGHHCNPYTHFYKRGYDEDFEKRLAYDCYQWLMENMLDEAVFFIKELNNYWDENTSGEDAANRIREKCNYKTYWDKTDEEREKETYSLDYNEEDMKAIENFRHNLNESLQGTLYENNR